MTIREVQEDDLFPLLDLYTHLHKNGMLPDSPALRENWSHIMTDSGHHIIVAEQDGMLVSSCVCVIISNLTHALRPYAFIENVVTRTEYRGRGLAGACLACAREIAVAKNCYKMMLLTGAKQESTLRFYARAGYNCNDKTAFVQWLDH